MNQKKVTNVLILGLIVAIGATLMGAFTLFAKADGVLPAIAGVGLLVVAFYLSGSGETYFRRRMKDGK